MCCVCYPPIYTVLRVCIKGEKKQTGITTRHGDSLIDRYTLCELDTRNYIEIVHPFIALWTTTLIGLTLVPYMYVVLANTRKGSLLQHCPESRHGYMNGLTTISVSIVECSWEQSSIYIPYTNINKNTEDVELNCIVTNIDTSIVCLHATCDLIY